MTAATDPIVAEIAAADSRRRLSFRVTFILTWVVLLGAFVIWLLTLPENSLTGRIVRAVWRVKDALLPAGTRRRSAWDSGVARIKGRRV